MVLVYKKAAGFGRRALSKTKLFCIYTTSQDKEEEERERWRVPQLLPGEQ